jgi:dihydroorotase
MTVLRDRAANMARRVHRKRTQMMRLMVVMAALFIANPVWAQVRYDLLLKGGHVIDPKNQIDGVMDVAIAGGKVARVAANIPATESRRVADVSGLYVTPGLVDMHVHLYASTGKRNVYAGDRSVYPDGFTFRSGVTTVVDLGTTGWRDFPDFKDRVIDRVRTRVLAMLNIVGSGMVGTGADRLEEQDTKDMDPQATAKRAREFPSLIVGIKTAHFNGPEWIAVDRAVEAATLANLPVVVDFGNYNPARPFADLVTKHLRPGDMSTHGYKDLVPFLDEKGKLRPWALEARKRGVKFDVGHGGGGFAWKNAIPVIQQHRFVPDSISTDLHAGSMNAGMKDMTNVMSKILNLDVPLADVIKMSTINPAMQIGRPELGHLGVGAGADVAVLRVDQGKFGFVDSLRVRLMGTKLLVCELTLRDGQVVWDLNGRTADPIAPTSDARLRIK